MFDRILTKIKYINSNHLTIKDIKIIKFLCLREDDLVTTTMIDDILYIYQKLRKIYYFLISLVNKK